MSLSVGLAGQKEALDGRLCARAGGVTGVTPVVAGSAFRRETAVLSLHTATAVAGTLSVSQCARVAVGRCN